MDCSSQAPLSMGFSIQEYWSGLPCPPPGELSDPGIGPVLLCFQHWQAISLPLALLSIIIVFVRITHDGMCVGCVCKATSVLILNNYKLLFWCPLVRVLTVFLFLNLVSC